jgi:hypothetical protein
VGETSDGRKRKWQEKWKVRASVGDCEIVSEGDGDGKSVEPRGQDMSNE